MSSASSTASLSSVAIASLARKPSVEIVVNDHYSSKVYTSGSAISGTVAITTMRDTAFDAIEIVLVGTGRTVDMVQFARQAEHTFLKLSMPVAEASYPVPRVLEAGRTHAVPFNFVLPHHLTISACEHRVQSDHIRDAHMRVPPTMGFWQHRDDMAPEMAQVEYAIKARVLGQTDLDDRPVRLMAAFQLLHVLPASPEDPPLSLSRHDRMYTPSRTKTVRRRLLAGRLGSVTATAVQPRAVMSSPDGRRVGRSTAAIDLDFVPSAADAAPPKVSSVTAKVTSTTYFSASPIAKMPNLGMGHSELAYDQRQSYSTTQTLFSTSFDAVSWKQQPLAPTRRDSGYGTDEESSSTAAHDRASRPSTDSSSPSSSSSAPAAVHHLASLHVPFTLPTSKKLWVPTFHSCLMSRVYTLTLNLSVGGRSMALSVPLQVGVEASPERAPSSPSPGSAVSESPGQGAPAGDESELPSWEAVSRASGRRPRMTVTQRRVAEEEALADEHLRPRVLGVPAEGFLERSSLPGVRAH